MGVLTIFACVIFLGFFCGGARAFQCVNVDTSEGPRTLQFGEKACAPLGSGETSADKGKNFITCVYNYIVSQSCHPALRFDVSSSTCTYPAQASCAFDSDTTTTTTTTTATTTTSTTTTTTVPTTPTTTSTTIPSPTTISSSTSTPSPTTTSATTTTPSLTTISSTTTTPSPATTSSTTTTPSPTTISSTTTTPSPATTSSTTTTPSPTTISSTTTIPSPTTTSSTTTTPSPATTSSTTTTPSPTTISSTTTTPSPATTSSTTTTPSPTTISSTTTIPSPTTTSSTTTTPSPTTISSTTTTPSPTTTSTTTTPAPPSGPCSASNCMLPNCFCFGQTPSLPLDDIPMFIMITFDDAVTGTVYNPYFKSLFVDNNFGLFNPDGCPMKTTFYLSHDNTEYNLVTILANAGHEFASHTVSHNLPTGDKDTDYPEMKNEIVGMRTKVSQLSSSPGLASKMTGFRAPYLRVAHDVMFDVLEDEGFLYDTTITNVRTYQNKAPLWPFTLDFVIGQDDCPNRPCPTKPYPGLWEVPINGWVDLQGYPCSFVDTCRVVGSVFTASTDEYKDLYKNNFNTFYQTKVPLQIFTHGSMFIRSPNSYPALSQFFEDVLTNYDDVWIVTPQQVISWMLNPQTVSQMRNQSWSCS